MRSSRGDDTLAAYKDRARNVGQSETPNRVRGGRWVDEEEADRLTQSAGASSTSTTARPT